MSAPESPQPGAQSKKKDRPPELDIPQHENLSPLDRDQRDEPNDTNDNVDRQRQPTLQVSLAEGEQTNDHDYPISRSTSTTSSLDPYYFGIRSPSDSPIPPLPTVNHKSTTPEQRQVFEPVTPGRDPANIDRRGLVGVGELATPRWAREEHSDDLNISSDASKDSEEIEGYEAVLPEELVEEDIPDSPWTLEAIDGEVSDKEDIEIPEDNAPEEKARIRPLRSKSSYESGGEEIVYPRKPAAPPPILPPPKVRASTSEPTPVNVEDTPLIVLSDREEVPTSPPSAFSPPTKRARKRTSEEFVMDQFGTLVSKPMTAPSKSIDDKIRKHKSLHVATGSTSSAIRDLKARERRRDSVGSTSSAIKSSIKSPDRHVRQTSTGSTSSDHHSRRIHTTDFSHLPPSPSSSSIQQFLRQPSGSGNSNTPPPKSTSKDNIHSSPNVAHSLLRGTQEGWSGLDDEATAEALRKLDGLSGKAARTRASVGSFGRTSSSSRPTTPATKSAGHQWEGIPSHETTKQRRTSGILKESSSTSKDKESRQSIGLGLAIAEPPPDKPEFFGSAISSDEYSTGISGVEKTPRKTGNASVRSSLTNKRGSTSSTTNASTPGSRDSAQMSVATSMTSVSGTSGRHSTGKARRNSASSDISNVSGPVETSLLRDRVASIATNGDVTEDDRVPPVPPLPKDLSTYRSPPTTSTSLHFTSSDEKEIPPSSGSSKPPTSTRTSFDIASPVSDSQSPRAHGYRASQHFTSGYTSSAHHSAPETAPAVPKTPSKKWSFSSALNLKIAGGSSSGSKDKDKLSAFPLSPRGVSFGQQIRKSSSKDKSKEHVGEAVTFPNKVWEPQHPEAMVSDQSLASLSSIGSIRTPAIPVKTPERPPTLSRTGTGSSVETHGTSGLSVPQSGNPLSPSTSVKRNPSKRLTPSSIPFFRRSSSQSMQIPAPRSSASTSSPTLSTSHTTMSTYHRQDLATSPRDSYDMPSTSVPGSAQKKSSMLSLGLPSLLKSSSRKSLHADSKEAKELQKLRDAEKSDKEKAKAEKAERKKEEKDRSESRISVLMGRKRGKTLSSTEPKKLSPVNLPPMQMTALEPATAQRVARLKTSQGSTSSGTSSASSSRTATASSSRATGHTASSMQKLSDSSLRSRTQLPTIAGSPSVATNGTNSAHASKEFREPIAPLLNALTKETPTKIPRISSRTSTAPSPQNKGGSAMSIRRASANANAIEVPSADASPTGMAITDEFGMIEHDEVPKKSATATPKHSNLRASPSTSSSRVPRQSTLSSLTGTGLRKTSRDSVSFSARKPSTSSIASLSTPAAPVESSSTSSHRFSALSPSKLKLISPKISLSGTRSSNNSNNNAANQSIHQAMGSPSSSRHSLSTPSPAPSTVDEDELLGDEEMIQYIRRQHAKKLAAGASQAELDEMLKFPEPLPPGDSFSPQSVIKTYGHQLSDYERKEILDYPSVYFWGAKSRKKMATPDNSTNNFSYDDDRGDYQIVNHDHLAYRYEVIDTLGKGSFGQVLQCRDHCTGESVAVKIIRNKKRFHHQALVEIKILENLKKWDGDGKHHVLKMIEHFYFRNHLCIATELLSINLYELIKANGFVGFTTALIRRFTSQMLMSLSLMRHHRIIHCDLKPENVLLRHPSKSAIKVIDFGSSCFEHEKIYTYIQSRFYRSPEVILGMNYHMGIDMWSLGCILAELYTGFPIFPGENEQEQLSCIMEVLGVPDKEYVNRSSRKKLFFDPSGAPRVVVNSKGRRRRPGTKTLSQVLRCNDDDFVDFIARCLVWDPERRMKPQAALRHPFITAGRKSKVPLSSSKASSSSLSGSRSKSLLETPKKSLISAPTPLTARSSRTTAQVGLSTPSSSTTGSSTLGSSSRSYRSSQNQGLSSYSSRTLSTSTKS